MKKVIYILILFMCGCDSDYIRIAHIDHLHCLKENSPIVYNDSIIGKVKSIQLINNHITCELKFTHQMNGYYEGYIESEDAVNQKCYIRLQKSNYINDTIFIYKLNIDSNYVKDKVEDALKELDVLINQIDSIKRNKQKP